MIARSHKSSVGRVGKGGSDCGTRGPCPDKTFVPYTRISEVNFNPLHQGFGPQQELHGDLLCSHPLSRRITPFRSPKTTSPIQRLGKDGPRRRTWLSVFPLLSSTAFWAGPTHVFLRVEGRGTFHRSIMDSERDGDGPPSTSSQGSHRGEQVVVSSADGDRARHVCGQVDMVQLLQIRDHLRRH